MSGDSPVPLRFWPSVLRLQRSAFCCTPAGFPPFRGARWGDELCLFIAPTALSFTSWWKASEVTAFFAAALHSCPYVLHLFPGLTPADMLKEDNLAL